jgi:hypothetical protein
MHKLEISEVIDFLSKDCKNREHQNCYGIWTGLGFRVNCCCLCHETSLFVREKKGEEGIQSLNLKSKVDQSIPKINVKRSNEDLNSNKNKDSFTSSVGLRNRELAKESC